MYLNDPELIIPVRKNQNHLKKLNANHPCMDEKAHNTIARLHLPVAPKCNILCRYCERQVCPSNINDVFPGISAVILSPSQALKKTGEFLKKWGRGSIVGISGPGDPLANTETFETMKYIRDKYPDVRLCLCTNGLALPENFSNIMSLGIRHLTVTVNAVDPSVGASVYKWITKNGIRHYGTEAASILLDNQLSGIKSAVKNHIFVKINTVVIPGINDHHISDVSALMANLGCFVHNIVPLIPRGELKDIKRPGPELMKGIRRESEPYIPVFSKCRQCRADAEGIPGKEGCCDKN